MDDMPDATPKLRVMVVDDSIDGAQSLGALLELLGCSTSIAFDGPEAVRAAVDFNPHLAIIDLEMPGMSGLDVLRQLRRSHPDRRTWHVCLTGRGQPDDESECLQAGFNAFHRKPMEPDALTDLLRAVEQVHGDGV
jgi:CheY-like chemotaxis protein